MPSDEGIFLLSKVGFDDLFTPSKKAQIQKKHEVSKRLDTSVFSILPILM